MNTENALKLADFLDSLPEKSEVGAFTFDLGIWYQVYEADDNLVIVGQAMCGTVGCIAGAAYYLNEPKLDDELTDQFAQKWLDLTDGEARELFTPNDEYLTDLGYEYHEITHHVAAHVLRDYAEHGHLDWDRALCSYQGAP